MPKTSYTLNEVLEQLELLDDQSTVTSPEVVITPPIKKFGDITDEDRGDEDGTTFDVNRVGRRLLQSEDEIRNSGFPSVEENLSNVRKNSKTINYSSSTKSGQRKSIIESAPEHEPTTNLSPGSTKEPTPNQTSLIAESDFSADQQHREVEVPMSKRRRLSPRTKSKTTESWSIVDSKDDNWLRS